VVTLILLLSVSFLLVHLVPGDPVRAALGPNVSEDFVRERRAILGLDQPLGSQYIQYWGRALSGEFGTSIATGLPVSSALETRWPRTLRLVALALPLTLVLAVVTGLGVAISSRDRRGWLRPAFRLGSSALAVIPDFFYAIFLVVVFAIGLGWLPAGGSEGLQTLVLPVVAMSLGSAAIISRLVWARSLEVLEAPYVMMARSKRLPGRNLYLRHVLPNVLVEALTLGGVLVGSMIAGSVVVETVFNINGIGLLLVQSLIGKDYPVIQACILILGLLVLVAHALVDLILVRLDPRSGLKVR
jgi:peptide/nickel transport system permease protein